MSFSFTGSLASLRCTSSHRQRSHQPPRGIYLIRISLRFDTVRRGLLTSSFRIKEEKHASAPSVSQDEHDLKT